MADTHAKHHDYHLVNPSPWPAVGATAGFVTAVGLIIWMRSMGGGEGLFGIKGPFVFRRRRAGSAVHHVGVVARCDPRGPRRRPHAGGSAASALRHDPCLSLPR